MERLLTSRVRMHRREAVRDEKIEFWEEMYVELREIPDTLGGHFNSNCGRNSSNVDKVH